MRKISCKRFNKEYNCDEETVLQLVVYEGLLWLKVSPQRYAMLHSADDSIIIASKEEIDCKEYLRYR